MCCAQCSSRTFRLWGRPRQCTAYCWRIRCSTSYIINTAARRIVRVSARGPSATAGHRIQRTTSRKYGSASFREGSDVQGNVLNVRKKKQKAALHTSAKSLARGHHVLFHWVVSRQVRHLCSLNHDLHNVLRIFVEQVRTYIPCQQ